MHELIRAWKSEALDGAPYLLKGDEGLLERRHAFVAGTLGEVLAHPDFDFAGTRTVHLGLLPVPFAGDLDNASIFVLLLNPGFKAADYFAELNNPRFAASLRGNLQQQPTDPLFPFPYLNPEFADTGGYRYWRDKLGALLDLARAKRSWSLIEALSYFSRSIAILEMFPYHSASFGLSAAALRQLRSVRLMREYVEDVLRPRAMAGEITVVITRQATYWGLTPSRDIVVYRGAAARGAYLTPSSAGGRAIMRRLRL